MTYSAGEVGHSDLVLVCDQSWSMVSVSLHARLQVSMSSGYDLQQTDMAQLQVSMSSGYLYVEWL